MHTDLHERWTLVIEADSEFLLKALVLSLRIYVKGLSFRLYERIEAPSQI